jgi:hypothetical protein
MFRKYLVALLLVMPFVAHAAQTSQLTDSSLVAPCEDGVEGNCSNFLDYNDFIAPLPGLGWASIKGIRTDTNIVYSIFPNTEALIPDSNFGIQAISFNFNEINKPFDFNDITIGGLPENWKVSYFKTHAGWQYDIGWNGKGNSRETSLDITFTAASDILEMLMSGTVTVHIAGFALDGTNETSAWFNGTFSASRDITPPVPLPASFWLLGSGLIGFATVAARRNKKS